MAVGMERVSCHAVMHTTHARRQAHTKQQLAARKPAAARALLNSTNESAWLPTWSSLASCSSGDSSASMSAGPLPPSPPSCCCCAWSAAAACCPSSPCPSAAAASPSPSPPAAAAGRGSSGFSPIPVSLSTVAISCLASARSAATWVGRQHSAGARAGAGSPSRSRSARSRSAACSSVNPSGPGGARSSSATATTGRKAGSWRGKQHAGQLHVVCQAIGARGRALLVRHCTQRAGKQGSSGLRKQHRLAPPAQQEAKEGRRPAAATCSACRPRCMEQPAATGTAR